MVDATIVQSIAVDEFIRSVHGFYLIEKLKLGCHGSI